MISPDSLNNLFIRTYQTDLIGHSHPYHQILIPLSGNIHLIMNNETTVVNYGEAYIIPKEVYHQFTAKTNFRFLVINTANLDGLSIDPKTPLHFPLEEKVLAFIEVIEKQLLTDFNQAINDCMLKLLLEFLKTSPIHKKVDRRLSLVLEKIKNNLEEEYSLSCLAKIACLSESHFKKMFKKQFGYTPKAYQTKLRMQKARSLIINTDMPIAIIAERCGYQNHSAFIRRFALFYHDTPQQFRLKNRRTNMHQNDEK